MGKIKNNFQRLVIFILLIGFSCAKIRPPYIVSDFLDIQQLERIDHQSCVNLKLNFDKANNLDSKLYWHCRVSFAKFHLEINPIIPRQIEFNQRITDLITKISAKISRNQETSIQREIAKIDENDHKKCLILGYDLESREQSMVEDYYLCRKNIIELNYSEPPYDNQQYSPYQNKSYDIAYVINKRIIESIKRDRDNMEKFPECRNFHPSSLDFSKCATSIRQFQSCVKDSNIKFISRENQEKIICQKQAYVRFHDDLIKNSERLDIEIKNRNLNSDRENKNDFSHLGINEDDFIAKDKKIAKQNLYKKSEKINDNRNMYSKQEISKLRKTFITNCLEVIDSELDKYKKDLQQQCEKLKFTSAD